jgi:hypothetical protein
MTAGARTVALVFAALLAAPASTAAPAAAPSLSVTPGTIEYGKGDIVLTGVVPSKRGGEIVTVLSQPCRFTEPAAIGTTRTGAGGVFRYRVQPMLNTSFHVRSADAASRAVRVGVKPIVELRKVGAGRYRIQVATTNPVFLAGKHVVLERAVGKRWVPVKRATLAKASPETAITVLSAATVSAKTTGLLRASLPASAGTCYLAAKSAPTGA